MNVNKVFIVLICILSSCADSRNEIDIVSDRLVKFAKQMEKKGLYAAGIGGGCTVDNKINLMDVCFDYNGVMNIESARSLIVPLNC